MQHALVLVRTKKIDKYNNMVIIIYLYELGMYLNVNTF